VVVPHDLIELMVGHAQRAQRLMLLGEAIRISIRSRDHQSHELFLASGQCSLLPEHGGGKSRFSLDDPGQQGLSAKQIRYESEEVL
jgi:hypothetical protein